MNLYQRLTDNAGRIALLGGGALLIVSYVLAFFFPALFFRAYLVAYIFWLGIALGCLAILMLHHMSGGMWGAALLRILEAGARTLPALTVIGMPLYLSIPWLFSWAHPQVVQSDPSVAQKVLYLNIPFFVARTVLYFVIWNALSYFLNRWSAERDRTGDPRHSDKLRRWGAFGEVIFGLTVTFAAIDWIMSLEPDWYSTIFPAMVALGGVLSGFAFAVLVFALLTRRATNSGVAYSQLLNDLGSLLLAFVMLWAYLSFSQYLLIWIANLTEEIPWYLLRTRGGWDTMALVVGLGYFVLPFALLIIRSVKRHAGWLAIIAALLVAARWIEVMWLVVPVFEPSFSLNLLDVITELGMGGVWIAVFAHELAKRPLLAPTERKLVEAQQWSSKAHAAE